MSLNGVWEIILIRFPFVFADDDSFEWLPLGCAFIGSVDCGIFSTMCVLVCVCESVSVCGVTPLA